MGKRGHSAGRGSRNGRPSAGVAGTPADRARQGAASAVRQGDPQRVLIHSNAPFTGTGYGVQCAALARSLAADGVDVGISTNYGVQGTMTEWEGLPVYPSGYHPYSADVLKAHWQAFTENNEHPAALVTLFDCWPYKDAKVDQLPAIGSWVPVDHLPAPPSVLKWCQRDNVLPIAMARFGARMLEAADVECRYAPHGVDTDLFRPGQMAGGFTGRQMIDVPDDAFLVGMFAANKGQMPNRKAFPENFLALAEFMRHRTDVVLYLHTEQKGAMNGIALDRLARACGIPEDRTVWVDQYAYYAGLDHRTVAALMASLDVNLLASAGEGFGVPVVEAAACGTPSIVSDFSAQPELVEGHGWKVGGQPVWDPYQGAWFHAPSVGGIVEALEDAYDSASQRRSAARAFALDYDHRAVYDTYWRPIIDELCTLANGGTP